LRTQKAQRRMRFSVVSVDINKNECYQISQKRLITQSSSSRSSLVHRPVKQLWVSVGLPVQLSCTADKRLRGLSVHTMKACEGVDVWLHAFFTSELDGGEWLALYASQFTPPGKALVAHIEQEAGRTPEPVWKLLRRDKYLVTERESNDDPWFSSE
jgi:hypothetical protein